MTRIVSRVGRAVTVAACLAATVTVLALAAVNFSGHHLFTVISGSMTPTFVAGDVVLVKPLPVDALRAGMVVTFHAPGSLDHLTTHRILALHQMPEGLFVQTKGDANPDPDPDYSNASAVLGEVTAIAPFVGRWLMFFESGVGRIITLGTPLLLLVLAQTVQTTRDLRRSRARRLAIASGAPTRVGRQQTGPSAGVTITLAVGLTVVAAVGGIVLGKSTSAVYAATTTAGANAFSTKAYCATTNYPAAVLANSPTIYHRLEETSGTSAADSGTGNRTGTYAGAPTLGAATSTCVGGRAVRFGTAGARVTNPNSFGSGLNGLPTYSLEAWVRTSTGGGISSLTAAGTTRWLVAGTDGRIRYLNGSTEVLASPAPVADGQWHHVALTNSAASGSMLYVDGVDVATGAATPVGGLLATAVAGFGNATGQPGIPASPDITLDELAVYTTELSAASIRTHVTEGRGK